MYLAIALVLIFVLYLIDKHNRWRSARNIVLALVGLVVLGFGTLLAWNKYQSWQDEKRQALIAAQRESAVQACVKRFKGQGAFDTAPCEIDPSAQPQPSLVPDSSPTVSAYHPRPVHLKRVKSNSLIDVEITTTEYGFLKSGTIKPGEIVSLLVDDGIKVKVRTNDGKIGWAMAGYFDLVE